ncbi:H-2 class I histocompatibility antigen, Q10 alpha chain-like [Peromyscus californicus insignis]|uniref:H-2 class I histocompatibility antigen, Q10 alpha chain-like n=1 Tax=Peromyscus californicus insignis TaxID=564181 RepID=UPI0022A6A965|nr:H-2 class I histocompatibility antigen, Q10 alpha chain-like [Peromyscus californicus insignis]
MKTLVPKTFLLLLLANLTLTRHLEGSNSLSYLQTLLTWPDLLEPQLIYAVYFNGIHIERFNSREEPPRLMHCAPWVDQQEPEYWDQRTEEVLRLMAAYKYMLKKMLHIYNLIETGEWTRIRNPKFQASSGFAPVPHIQYFPEQNVSNHTIQILMACDVLPGGNLSHVQYEFIFNGHDYVVLNKDLSTWTAVGKAAEVLRQNWEASGFAKSLKNYLQYEGVKLVLRQLVYGKEILLRTDTPKIHVTRKVRANGKITLRCWALDFYPADITLTWQRDRSNQSLNMEVIETRPAGDGTFQKWASVVVPSGKEQRYTCHVNHEGLPEPLTLRWEPPQPSDPIMPIVTGLVLGAVLMGAVVTFLIWKRRTKG